MPSLPVKNKVWDVDPNNVGGITSTNVTTDLARTIIAIKEAMTGGGSGEVTAPYVVAASSNAALSGGGDHWSSALDIVASSGAHSWIVLTNPATGYQICFDLNSSYARRADMYRSQSGGFVGGSTTARPVAPDEVAVFVNQEWMGTWTVPFSSRVHVMASTDGTAVYVIVFVGGVCSMMWLLCDLIDPPAGLPNPTLFHVSRGGNTTAQRARVALFDDTTSMQMLDSAGAPFGTVVAGVALIVNGQEVLFSLDQATASQDDQSFPMAPVSIWSRASGTHGYKGYIPDLYWGLAVNNPGDHFPAPPAAPLYQWAQIGDIIVPWNGTSPMQVA